jgi:hypothetical protein
VTRSDRNEIQTCNIVDCNVLGLGMHRFGSPRSLTGRTNSICKGGVDLAEKSDPPNPGQCSMINNKCIGYIFYNFVFYSVRMYYLLLSNRLFGGLGDGA